MLKIEKYVTASPEQLEMVIEGMRNPYNSWDLSDSSIEHVENLDTMNEAPWQFHLGEKDHDLMMRLAKGGPVHAKYRRMIPVWVTITAPLYWWKEFDTYKVGTVCNSCSTMHKIAAKEFTKDDFSWERTDNCYYTVEARLAIIKALNDARGHYLAAKKAGEMNSAKMHWNTMIQLLPSSYNQTRTIMITYEVCNNIYHSREGHPLEEWAVLRKWIEILPYSDIITCKDD